MIPVQQTTFTPDPDAPDCGNCFAACVASILEMPIEKVPNFVQERGHPVTTDWWDRFLNWLYPLGYSAIMILPSPEALLDGAYSVVTGNSPRGDFDHCVVYYGKEMAHDPHPERIGIGNKLTDAVYFVKRNPAKV